MKRDARDSLFAIGAVLFVLVLIVIFARREPSLPTPSAARISPRNPAQKESLWEANGAREAIDGAKELCKEAGSQLLHEPATVQWDDASAAFGAETSPGRYHVTRRIRAGRERRLGLGTAVDCRIRRDGDHFQLITIDSSGG